MRRQAQCVRRLALAAVIAPLLSTTATFAGDKPDDGQAIYKRANCVGCHKWHGQGGGGYGGAALSLRETVLDEEMIVQTISCGRPGTGMPYFVRDAYSDDPAAPHPCNGLTRHDLGADMPVAEAGVFLRPAEIAAVADYVLKNLKGKGQPTLAECAAFFGSDSRACETYQPAKTRALPTPSTTQ
jgi:mono/diheme cytochrome c family protein